MKFLPGKLILRHILLANTGLLQEKLLSVNSGG